MAVRQIVDFRDGTRDKVRLSPCGIFTFFKNSQLRGFTQSDPTVFAVSNLAQKNVRKNGLEWAEELLMWETLNNLVNNSHLSNLPLARKTPKKCRIKKSPTGGDLSRENYMENFVVLFFYALFGNYRFEGRAVWRFSKKVGEIKDSSVFQDPCTPGVETINRARILFCRPLLQAHKMCSNVGCVSERVRVWINTHMCHKKTLLARLIN